jgi:crotonobetainyl-CoA:carnitine CoA-transferase CaiB-like acyl-CoA transferase
MSLPLEGVRVLAVEQYGAGPFGTQHLADLGAEVIKVENFKDGGDIGRSVGPHFFGPGDSHFFQAFNRNKRSLALDLKHPDGRAVFLALVARCDAVFDNLRGDLPASLGLTYAALAETNPRVVSVHLSAYGRTGSSAAWPGYDYLMQAEAGYLSLTGEPDGPPSRFGLSIVDLMTGTTAAMALLAGLLEARASGKGRDLDVSLFDVSLHTLAYVATWYLNAGVATERQPRSGHPSLTPSQLYRTADGWIFLMCNKEKFWRVFAEIVDRPDWLSRPETASFAARLANRPQVNAEIDAVLQTATTADWIARFAGRVPAAPVLDVPGALDNPFLAEQARILSYAADGHAPVHGIASPVRVPGEAQPQQSAPALGADSDALLAEIGYTAARIEALREAGVIA